MRLLIRILILLLFFQIAAFPAFGEDKEANASTISEQKNQSILKSVRTIEHKNFTRIVFEFHNAAQFKDPTIKDKGKFSVLFLDSSTDLAPLTVYETDSLQKVQSIEFIKNKSNLTATVSLKFPHFMIEAFSLSDPDRIVADAYKLTDSTKDYLANTSLNHGASSEVSKQPETKEDKKVPEKSPTKEIDEQFSEASSEQTSEEIRDDRDTVTFPITLIDVSGNTVLSSMEIKNILKPYTGPKKTAEDVEKARSVLEKYFHQKGYPTALVNIPEQSVEDGIVRLEVIESKVRRIRIVGNRYFTMENLLKEMPAFHPGEILYLPKVKEQLARVNRNPDLKVAPILMPGKKLGTIDVEFRVKDKLPLHGSLELNNRSSHSTTTSLRLNGMIRYDNLWQKEHSIVFQFQTAPEDTDEVKLYTGSYSLPAPWNDDQMVILYTLFSDSDTAIADNISVVGKGKLFGGQWMIPLPAVESYFHNMIVGLDYKDFEDKVAEDIETPIKYFPLHASYSGVLPDSSGQTRFNFGVNMNLRQTGSDMTEFREKRFGSKNNFFYATMGLERFQKLPWGMHVWLSADGQLASQPLISNEQYVAGGIRSVRGYKENESAGDDALHFSCELRGPDIGHLANVEKWLKFTPYLFYDYADLHIQDPLPQEPENTTLMGGGAGARGYLFKHLEYQFDLGVALEDTEETEAGDYLSHFFLKFKF